MQFILDLWYRTTPTWLARLLLPLAWCFWLLSRIRAIAYKIKLLRSYKVEPITIIIGNITVGGTGKTPVVIALATLLQNQGFKVGIISRGYCGSVIGNQLVNADCDPRIVGDEPVLIVSKTNCPVIVNKDRVAAAVYLQNHFKPDLILSDDGLQHYRLQRDLEIIVISGERRFGNGYFLPAGPLRESPKRLKQADLILTNSSKPLSGEYEIKIKYEKIYNLVDHTLASLQDFIDFPVHVVTGIGEPQKLFAYLQQQGMQIITHVFPDHYSFKEQDLNFADPYPIIITEKDAVKCKKFTHSNCWVLPIKIELPEACILKLLQYIKEARC